MDVNCEEHIDRLLLHSEMYLWWCKAVVGPLLQGGAAYNFYMFGGLHLVSAMFLIDGDGGLFGRTLKAMGRGDLLVEVSEVLQSAVGDTTLGDYLRLKRNKLATHGDMSFESQSAEVQAITFCDESQEAFDDAMYRLEDAVHLLRGELLALRTC